MSTLSLSQETDFESTATATKLHAILTTPNAFIITEKRGISASAGQLTRSRVCRTHQFEEEQARGLEFLFGS